jgi:putative heme iron utilization protein
MFHPGALDDLVAVPAGRCRFLQVFIDLAEWTTIVAGASGVVLEVEASFPHMRPDRGHQRYPVLKQ